MKLKKFFKWLVVAMVLAAVVGGVVWVGINWDALMSKTTLVSKEYAEEQYKQGFKDGEKNEGSATVIDTLNYQLRELTEDFQEISSELEATKAQLVEKDKERDELLAQVEALQARVAELVTEQARLIELLEACQSGNETVYVLNFYLDEANQDLFATKIVSESNPNDFTLDNPADTVSHTFKGWTIGGQVVDLSTFQISGNMTFTAKFEEREKTYVQFVVSQDFSTKIEKEYYVGQLIDFPQVDNLVGWAKVYNRNENGEIIGYYEHLGEFDFESYVDISKERAEKIPYKHDIWPLYHAVTKHDLAQGVKTYELDYLTTDQEQITYDCDFISNGRFQTKITLYYTQIVNGKAYKTISKTFTEQMTTQEFANRRYGIVNNQIVSVDPMGSEIPTAWLDMFIAYGNITYGGDTWQHINRDWTLTKVEYEVNAIY